MLRMSNVTVKPGLSPKVRFRFDRRTGRFLLLYPERGLELNGSAAEIARLCTGEWTVQDVAQRLADVHVDASPDEVIRDVRNFIGILAARGLLQDRHD
jgi:coenzyme PQQ biosynthesis protein PqqD